MRKLFTNLHVLNVINVSTNTSSQLNTPLINSSLDDSVVEAIPVFDKTLLIVVDIVDSGTVDLSLQHAPYIENADFTNFKHFGNRTCIRILKMGF